MDRAGIRDLGRELGLLAFVCRCGCRDRCLQRARRDFGIEQVSAARYCLDQAVIVVRKFAAQLPNALSNGIVRNDDIGPDGLIEILLGNQAPRIGGEVFENLKSLRSQLDILITRSQAPACEVQRELVEIQGARHGNVQHLTTPSG